MAGCLFMTAVSKFGHIKNRGEDMKKYIKASDGSMISFATKEKKTFKPVTAAENEYDSPANHRYLLYAYNGFTRELDSWYDSYEEAEAARLKELEQLKAEGDNYSNHEPYIYDTEDDAANYNLLSQYFELEPVDMSGRRHGAYLYELNKRPEYEDAITQAKPMRMYRYGGGGLMWSPKEDIIYSPTVSNHGRPNGWGDTKHVVRAIERAIAKLSQEEK